MLYQGRKLEWNGLGYSILERVSEIFYIENYLEEFDFPLHNGSNFKVREAW